ncbi:FecCD family ABC transporter permease [Paenibacillus puerhi]|uniref:FecCD family ABC transporter permease n=1 Tax=Paenibacillus puerhi TaxID=2692622 RepID=UPI001356C843|nr:iron ABC transporter permease [Paenibacillus puerhi]
MSKLKLGGMGIILILVVITFMASLAFGLVGVSMHSVSDAFLAFDGSNEQLIVRTVRLPRALIAGMVGSSLAVAGAVMQALGRNALAGPELFGVNYGAALATVIALFLVADASLQTFVWSALLGAGAAGAIVFLLGSWGRERLTSVKLVLIGATMNLLLASITQGVLILHQQSLDTMRFWLAGSLTGRDLELMRMVLPYMSAGLLGALLLGKQISLISLGDEVAQSLGQRLFATKAVCIGVILLLAGSAVALAGPIGFVGLAVPHIARFLVGTDYRWILPYSALLGALLLMLADIGARFVLPSQEVPVGVVTAFFGAPFLIYLAQRRQSAA